MVEEFLRAQAICRHLRSCSPEPPAPGLSCSAWRCPGSRTSGLAAFHSFLIMGPDKAAARGSDYLILPLNGRGCVTGMYVLGAVCHPGDRGQARRLRTAASGVGFAGVVDSWRPVCRNCVRVCMDPDDAAWWLERSKSVLLAVELRAAVVACLCLCRRRRSSGRCFSSFAAAGWVVSGALPSGGVLGGVRTMGAGVLTAAWWVGVGSRGFVAADAEDLLDEVLRILAHLAAGVDRGGAVEEGDVEAVVGAGGVDQEIWWPCRCGRW